MTRPWNRLRAAAAALMMVLAVRAGCPAEEGYRRVDGPCSLSFPGSHDAHRMYKTEWWYYTGNVTSQTGEPFGFQLTFFRTALRPPQAATQDAHRSAWRTSQLLIAHAAVTDVDRKLHLSAEATAREALDLAGVRREKDTVTVRCRGWRAQLGPETHRLGADADRFALDLTLTPQKPPVLHGENGYSRKGSTRDRASCYYSFTRLAADGKIRIGERTLRVSGLAWMDHEFSTAPLEPGLVGWDWFSLQLSDQSELMVYCLRNRDGSFHSASSGTFVDAAGRATSLGREQFSVKVLDRWKSPGSGAFYPVAWRLSVSALDLTLRVRARVQDQEMTTRKSTGVVYWEGSVAAEGTAAGRPVSASGYVELTGYAHPFDAPM